MDIPAYDIFSGLADKDPYWLETVADLPTASEHMKQRAEAKPGSYFVFCSRDSTVVDAVDTTVTRPNAATPKFAC